MKSAAPSGGKAGGPARPAKQGAAGRRARRRPARKANRGREHQASRRGQGIAARKTPRQAASGGGGLPRRERAARMKPRRRKGAAGGRGTGGHGPARAREERRRCKRPSGLLRAREAYYVARAAEGVRVYTDRDGNGVRLPNPARLTLAHLYVNGVLQPPDRYRLRRGRLRLLTPETPAPGTPLVLHMIALWLPRGSSSFRAPVRSRNKANPVSKPLSPSYVKVSDKKGVERSMPPSLIKTFMAATSVVSGTIATTTTTNVVNTVLRFDTLVTGDMIDTVAGTTTIPAASFRNDAGDALTGTLPVVNPGGYYNVYVNGILQEGGLSALTTTALTIASDAILAGTPVNLEIHDYTSTTSTSNSVPSLTVSTTIAT